MSYKDQYNRALADYQEKLNRYEEAVTSSRYHEILSTMPFLFLNAVQLCERLEFFASLKKKPRMYFSTLEETKVLYRNLITFHNKADQLLEEASFVADIGKLAEDINEYALQNPYLGAAFCVEPNHEIINVAKQCLSEIPKYPKMLTKEFRWKFIESSILSLDQKALENLVATKVIKADDIDHISLLEESEEYKEKIEFLCELLHRSQPLIASFKLKLKGVSFPNDDGSSRQENLTDLKTYASEHPGETIRLTAESYTYVPAIGNPEPAIKIAWDGKVIGNIAKDVAAEIFEKYTHPQLTATLDKVSGGDDKICYGCTIYLNIVAPGYKKDLANEAEFFHEK